MELPMCVEMWECEMKYRNSKIAYNQKEDGTGLITVKSQVAGTSRDA